MRVGTLNRHVVYMNAAHLLLERRLENPGLLIVVRSPVAVETKVSMPSPDFVAFIPLIRMYL